ncbi:MAG TPA: dynamin family protein [Syntrophobacteraceae bacterium]|nr:dynamin family protein [Syntrophobacteraceae bacterium]
MSQNTIPSPGPIREYVRLREEVLQTLDGMMSIEATSRASLGELREKIATDTFNLVVVGQFKRGKTCLINALLGAELLPVSVVPLTSIVTILTYGTSLEVKVFTRDGRATFVEPDRIAEYVTEQGNPQNVKNVREVVLTYPSEYLKDGVRLVDTPGVGSVYQHNTDVAYQYLPKSDAALFLLSVDQPVSRAELDFLKDVQQYSGKIFFLLNKIDYLTGKDLEDCLEFSEKSLRDVMGQEVKIFPVSAKLALDGKIADDPELLARSRLTEFSRTLDRFLMNEKGKVLLLSATNSLLRLLAQARLEVELELRSLTIPLEDLKEKVRSFEEKKEEILLESRAFDILLDGEVNRLVRTLDEELAAFKAEKVPEVLAWFEALCDTNRNAPLQELDLLLENQIREEVQKVFTPWHARLEDKISAGFEGICRRFLGKMDQVVDDLLAFSSQLFSVPYRPILAEALWRTESGFYFKLRDEPVGLDMLADALTLRVPGMVSRRFEKIKDYLFRKAHERIRRKRKQQLVEAVETQAGRIRYDFLDRLEKSKRKFRVEMRGKIEATMEGIGTAVEKGITLREKGEREIKDRGKFLERELQELAILEGKVARTREAVSGL